ncbi:hypothetical protein SAMN06295974_3789 [Plantibacter flavus]|uniref:Uncharacterized protein n=1 Tax=Plantibacter flavus TaxID=150123 RepID=A0A3N2BLB2_9MICO|nr:hypothetical protein [Plantibacter flavus]ROR76063.1 hypothetical protein EDD42_4016 [Plantibacter flavus]SMG48940.1 hypothetical protein SAMN06295974_3789 [Plantibacter flavus]
MLNRYMLARLLGGLLGLAAGYLVWQLFWDTVLWELPHDALNTALTSGALVNLISIAAVALIMVPGLALSALAEFLTKRLTRTSASADSMVDQPERDASQ